MVRGKGARGHAQGLDMNSFTVLYPLCRILDAGDQTYNLFTHLWPPDNAETTTRLVSSATLSDGDVVYFSEGSWNILLNRISALPRLATEGASEVRSRLPLHLLRRRSEGHPGG